MPLTPARTPTRVISMTARASDPLWRPSTSVIAWLSMLGTSVWKMRLAKESAMAVRKLARCEEMMGKIRRHQGREPLREICARGPG